MSPATLDRNLKALHSASEDVRKRHTAYALKRFYYLLLMECAERMTPGDFIASIAIAREQLRKPL